MMKKNRTNFLPAVVLVLILCGVAVGYALFGDESAPSTGTGTTATGSTAQSGSTACTTDYAPVCGEDGRTYSNRCVAEKQNNIAVVSEGMCPMETDPLDSLSGSTGATSTNSGGPLLDPDSTSAPEYIDPNFGGNNDGDTSSVPDSTPSGETGSDFIRNIDMPGDSSATNSTGATATAASATPANAVTYSNASVGYAFDMPKSSYYQGFGAQQGAAHSVAIQTGTGVTDFASATVRVLLYNSVLEPLAGNDRKSVPDAAGNRVYVRVGSGKTAIVEGSSVNDATVQMVVSSLREATAAPATATGSTTPGPNPDTPIGQ